MISAASFSGTVPWKRLCHEASKKPALGSKTTCRFGKNGLAVTPHFGHVWRRERDVEEANKPRNKLTPYAASNRGMSSDSNPLSPSEAVEEFYACINEGKLKQLGGYISADCCLDECSFVSPFRGKKAVLRFFDQLIESLGQNVKFKIYQVCEGGELIAAASWHLEWKKSQIPFTRGCSFFECSKEGNKIMIKKARIVIESPVKPGGLVLTLLQIVTTVFDNFPKTTQWFLKSPDIIIQWLIRIYIIFFGILINPFLKTYSQVWSLTTRSLGYAFKIILYILSFFTN